MKKLLQHASSHPLLLLLLLLCLQGLQHLKPRLPM